MIAKTASIVVTIVLLIAVGVTTFHWTYNLYYVPVGYSLQLRYKGPLIFGSRTPARSGYWADETQVGVRQKLRGPGRHFYSPIWYERVLVEDTVIHPGQVGIVTCRLGEALDEGQYLVDGNLGETKYKGILRKALAPGRYRINPYGYQVNLVKEVKKKSGNQEKRSGWVTIPTGYVGVVTNLAANPATNQLAGIQENVLPPGIYPINGREQEIDIVEIGYRETTVKMEKVRKKDRSLELDEAGEPLVVVGTADSSGIDFPSNDGFNIYMDFTAIWGLMPDQAPHAVRTFGNVDEVEDKVVKPQIDSICRNSGSKYSAVELLVGEDRERFQQANLDALQAVLSEKKISLQYGLVRHIYIPKEVREPIQRGFVADELTLTRKQEQETAKAEALLRQAEKNVDLEEKTVIASTERKYQQKVAEGDRQAKTIEAETELLVAAIKRGTATLEADAVRLLGEAENKGKQMVAEATADRFRLAVEAFGSNSAYNKWIFATGLPDDIDLKFFYAGEGTMWTDMDNIGLRANVPVKTKK